ncbi:TPA: hypothetical protein ACXN0H_004334 [Enterobacter hormaechei]|uniref:hypothetical protein n=1 Tax=Enterobacter TaxID=547 RepID=UPI000791A3C7|nr:MULTISPECIES: hypothetical protein [Enterobacter]ELN9421072.1 hypothetical protein [Enterobacter ludwigii]AOP81523.1 hypothetical protein BFV66_05680 [Enterobacter hormaechei subsp. oharae]ELY2041166.1 hypothetical protein [Enterobacter ludwigii]KAB5475442.1 hypothetical protein F8561_21175 [Enterobacter sp. 198]QLN95404.1 hypothetical protein HV125_17045 [Enterobacter hormaechei]
MLEARQIAELLNQLFAIDPAAAADLVNHRVVCNDAFLGSDIPFVCSQSRDGVITMGMVGFVNAMAKPGTGYAAAVYDDDGQLTGFTVVGVLS